MPKRRRWEAESIDFMGEGLKGIVQPHEDSLVVTLQIKGFDVKRVMVDQGSRVEAFLGCPWIHFIGAIHSSLH